MTLGNFLKSKPAFLVAICILLLLLGSIYQKKSQQHKIDQEKAELEKQAYEIETKNLELQKSLEYLSSDSSKEKVARAQLNLKKQGEVVYSFAQGNKVDFSEPKNPENTDSNFKKWLYYFSKPN